VKDKVEFAEMRRGCRAGVMIAAPSTNRTWLIDRNAENRLFTNLVEGAMLVDAGAAPVSRESAGRVHRRCW